VLVRAQLFLVEVLDAEGYVEVASLMAEVGADVLVGV